MLPSFLLRSRISPVAGRPIASSSVLRVCGPSLLLIAYPVDRQQRSVDGLRARTRRFRHGRARAVRSVATQALGDNSSVEAEPRLRSAPEPDDSELVRMLIHPRPSNGELLGHFA